MTNSNAYETTNFDLIRQVFANIILYPENYNQQNWITFNCRTTGCVAGLIALTPIHNLEFDSSLPPHSLTNPSVFLRSPHRGNLDSGVTGYVSALQEDIDNPALNPYVKKLWSWEALPDFIVSDIASAHEANVANGYPDDLNFDLNAAPKLFEHSPRDTPFIHYIRWNVDFSAPDFIKFNGKNFKKVQKSFIEIEALASHIIGIPRDLAGVLFHAENTLAVVSYILGAILDREDPDEIISIVDGIIDYPEPEASDSD